MSEPTDFLYPMIDGTETDAASLLADLARSAGEKASSSAQITLDALDQWDATLTTLATEIVARTARGGRIFTCGNGGSATDAEGVAALFASPPYGTSLAARSLVADVSILTALANDIGFAAVFSRQLIAHATSDDTLLGFSTSGNSRNVIDAFDHAHSKGLLTVGFAGDRGGAMATSDAIDHCITIKATSIHRIQEAQSALAYVLWERIQSSLGAPGASDPRGATP